MSGLAEILLTEGFTISDPIPSARPFDRSAGRQGIYNPSSADNLTDDIDLVVYGCHPQRQSGICSHRPKACRPDTGTASGTDYAQLSNPGGCQRQWVRQPPPP